jgi:dihydrofolate synthase/folylpolyglutamate synthase
LDALGYRYASYTSPHLFEYNERIQLQGAAVSDDELLRSFEAVEEARGDTSLTYFEFGTLAAFELMSRSGLDFAVLEVGLGGRLDAVNLLDGDCAGITPVGLDHQEYLGDDLELIAAEKAGIIRPGRPLVCGEPEPPRSIPARARELGAPLVRLGREFTIRVDGDLLHYATEGRKITLPMPAMIGEHQPANMATALTAVLQLLPEAANRAETLAQALGVVRLPGRLQQVRSEPMVLVDVGHNPMAAQAVHRTLAQLRREGRIGNVRCVIGMLKDKDAESVARCLGPLVGQWFCAGLPGSRAQSGAELSRRISDAVGASRIKAFGSVGPALSAALSAARATECILVFGSFQTAAEAVRSLRQAGTDTARIQASGAAPPGH